MKSFDGFEKFYTLVPFIRKLKVIVNKVDDIFLIFVKNFDVWIEV